MMQFKFVPENEAHRAQARLCGEQGRLSLVPAHACKGGFALMCTPIRREVEFPERSRSMFVVQRKLHDGISALHAAQCHELH